MSRSKVIPLSALADMVPERSTVGLGGAWFSNHPMAAIRQLARDRVAGLHLVETMGSIDIDLAVGAGVASEVTFSMVSLEIFGLAPQFRRAVERGQLKITEMTGCALNTAIDAAARNVPFLPLAPLGRSDIPEKQPGCYATIEDPFTGTELLAIRAIKPDVVIVHALRADADGNAQYDGPLAIDPELARAGTTVIVTCEEIVPTAVVQGSPSLTVIPGFLVDAVIEAPFGAHPTTHVPRYGFDAWSVRDYVSAAASLESWSIYLAQILAETEDEYRERLLPPQRRRVLEALPRSGPTLAQELVV